MNGLKEGPWAVERGVKKAAVGYYSRGVEKATGPAGGVMSDFSYPQSASSQSRNFYNTVDPFQ